MRAYAIALLLLWAGALAPGPPLPSRSLSVLRGDGVRVDFTVEVARNDAERRSGLMGRRALPARHGMLFDFAAPIIATMWMKDTPLALDMLFLDAQGRVVWIVERTTPGSLELLSAPMKVRYVLEINAGEARGLAIARGDRALVLGGGEGLESGAKTLE